jgi:pimeloyl-ACP methyl ester carboxylesterase
MVVTVDIRGYGRSSKVTTPYSLEDMCDDVIAVMKDLGIARCVLGGCSVGSSIALLLALDHPEMFDAVILVGGNSAASARFPARIEGYRKNLAEYHPQHIKQLVQPAFADTRLGC